MNIDVSTVEGYEIATALRGPDIADFHFLKDVLTCRLRYFLDCDDSKGIIRSEPLTKRGVNEACAEIFGIFLGKYDRAALIHYFHHLSAGFNALYSVGRISYKGKNAMQDLIRPLLKLQRLGRWRTEQERRELLEAAIANIELLYEVEHAYVDV